MDFILNNLGKIIWSVIGLVAVALIIKFFKNIKKFVLEVYVELKKVAWSTKEELLGSTVVVIVTTSIVAVYLFIIDGALTKFLSVIFK
ncbi:MAG: preprotein translocase subunit SecE [Candidatus Omnitrophica bacterium]|nr:preprotein translocase subunit SecE [Candidatus Omnitrophota bacterium]